MPTCRASHPLVVSKHMGIADLLTPGQAAHLLGIDTSTLRRYARQFSAHLSEHANQPRRHYTATDIATLRHAQTLLRTHTPKDAVELLAVIEPDAAPPAIVESQLPALVGELERARELLADLTARIDNVESDRDTDRATIDNQAHELTELRTDHERLRTWIETPFWLRMFKPPPE